MAPTIAVLLLILPLTMAQKDDPTDYTSRQKYLGGPTKHTKNPLSSLTFDYVTPGFQRWNGIKECLNDFQPMGFIRMYNFPAYIELNVSQTVMRDRDPITKECLEDALLFYDGFACDGPLVLDVCGRETPILDIMGLGVCVVFRRNGTEERIVTGATVDITAVYGKIPPLEAERDQLDMFVFPSYGYNLTQDAVTLPPPPPPIRRTITIEASNKKDTVIVYVNATDMSGYDADTGNNATDMSGYNATTGNSATDMSGYNATTGNNATEVSEYDAVTRNCSEDKVIFYDGMNTSAPVLATVCGTDTPTIRSTGRAMTVYFEGTALSEGVKKGMTISYQAEGNSTDDDDDGGEGGDGGTATGIGKAFVVVVALITAGIVY